MRLTRAALLLGAAALLPVTAHAQTSTAPQPPAATRGDGVKPINFTERTLANGLRVYAIRDTNTSNVSVQVWYDVGSKDDPKGRSGFAHMFEHLMFKATRNLKAEQMDRLTEDVGGYNNASTNDDYTNYYEVVPANHLQRLLFAEADRMASLVVDQAVFNSERDVVKEELRSRVLAAPYGKLFYLYFPEISYTRLPYGRPGIGSIADLDAATIDDIRAFHATYYRPDNAILVVSGNFDPAELDKWVDQYFAPIKKPAGKIPRVTATEPVRTQATHYTVYEPNTPLPAVMISYQMPADNSPDIAALRVLDAILSAGDSSRLYQSLVYTDQLAQSANTYLDTKQSAGALGVYAIMASGKTAAEGEAALRAQIAKLRDAPVTARELTEAKNEIITSELESRETAEGKASTLASSIIIDGDPHAADKQLAAIQQVTAADVQRVARKYLTDNRSAAIRYLPESQKPAGATGNTVTVPSTIAVEPLTPPANIPVVKEASDADRILPPKPGPAVQPDIPTATTTTLASGMKLVVVERHDLPLVTASVEVTGGGALDPRGKAGLYSMTADLMTKGTTTRSATEIANAIETLGGSIDSDAGWDGQSVDVTVRSNQLAPALDILADVTRNPVFAQAEIDRDRAQTSDAVSVQLKDPGALSGIIANRLIYGDMPYGHLLSGTPDSLKAITRGDVQQAYRDSWRPDRATLILVGDVTQAQAKQLADKLFGDWSAAAAAAPLSVDNVAKVPASLPDALVVDLPDAGQAGVVVARRGIARADPDYYPAIVANTVLGGGFSSRLNQEIRIKRGLAYGAGSSLDARRAQGPFMARTQTKNPSAPEVVSIIRTEMARMGGEPVSAEELTTRKAVLTGGFGRRVETNSGVAGVVGSYVIEGVPLTELQRFIPSVNAVTPAEVQQVSATLLDPAKTTVVVVGDAKQFVDKLRADFPHLSEVEAKDVNLDSPTLK